MARSSAKIIAIMNIIGMVIMGDMMRRSFGHDFFETSKLDLFWPWKKAHFYRPKWQAEHKSLENEATLMSDARCNWPQHVLHLDYDNLWGRVDASDWLFIQPIASTEHSTMLRTIQMD